MNRTIFSLIAVVALLAGCASFGAPDEPLHNQLLAGKPFQVDNATLDKWCIDRAAAFGGDTNICNRKPIVDSAYIDVLPLPHPPWSNHGLHPQCQGVTACINIRFTPEPGKRAIVYVQMTSLKRMLSDFWHEYGHYKGERHKGDTIFTRDDESMERTAAHDRERASTCSRLNISCY